MAPPEVSEHAVVPEPRARPVAAVVVVAVAVASVCWAALGSFYTTDDHVFFWQAREQSFGLRFLTEPIYDHLSPWHRLNHHIAGALGGDYAWWPTALVAIGWCLATLGAGWLLVRELAEARRAVAPVGLALLAVSPVLVQAGQWWAVAAQGFPQLAFGFLALWAGVRASRGGGRGWAALAVLAYGLALCGFIKALLLPAVLLVLAGRPRRTTWALWAGLAAVSTAYLLVISGDRYYRFVGELPPPTGTEWLELLVLGLLGGTVPAVFGAAVGQDPGALGLAVVALTNLALAALVAFTVRRAPSTWRPWAGAGAVAVLALVMSGGARLGEQGAAYIAFQPRYTAEGAIALQLAAVVALARTGLPGRRVLVAAAAALVVLTVGSTVRQDREWVADRHRAWFTELSRSTDELRAAGLRPAVVDGVTPGFLVADPLIGLNLLSKVVPLREPGLPVGVAQGTPVLPRADGRLVPVRLGAPGPSRPSLGPGACLEGPSRPLSVDLDLPPSDLVHVLDLRFEPLERPFAGVVVADSGAAANEVAGTALPPRITTYPRVPAGRTSWRFLVAGGRLDRVTLTADAGSRMCLRDVAVRSTPLP